MNYLLDASTVIAGCVSSHTEYVKTTAWLANMDTSLCAISELALIRVAVQRYGLDIAGARSLLEAFKKGRGFVPCDNGALDGNTPPSASLSTDWYLANLAQKHGMKLATLDQGISHKAAELIV